jgi:hypothetical protein
MAMIKTDFTNTRQFPLAKEGEQWVLVEDVYPKQSKSGKDMVVFEFRTSNEAKLFHNCMNEETNRWMLKKTLEAITGRSQPHGPVTINTEELIGQKVKVYVIHEEYQGNTKARVEDVIPDDEIAPGQMEIDKFESGEVLGNESAPF